MAKGTAMKNLTLENIAKACSGEYRGESALLGREITAVVKDSREIVPGCLFAAIKGERSDGNDFIASSLASGAACALGQRVPEGCGGPVIIVEDTVKALGDIAKFYRSQFDIPVLGVTGSVGKTTAKEMICSVLSQRFRVHRTPENLNNDLGVPLSVFGIDESTEVAIIEMGISHFGEMTRLAEIVSPTMALYTTIGSAHLEFLGDLSGVLKAKTEMIPMLDRDAVVFTNGDDPYLNKIACHQKLSRYGISPNCDVVGSDIHVLGTEGMELMVSDKCRCRSFAVKINSYGIHLVTAALGAAAVGMELGLTNEEIAAGIASYRPVGSRSSIVETGYVTIIDDCYNANPTSTDASLKSLGMLSCRRVAILGDMMELGPEEKKLHFTTGVHAADCDIDLLLACGELSQNTVEGAKSTRMDAIWFDSKEALISALPQHIQKGDAVLVKASHSRKFEDIVEALKKLG